MYACTIILPHTPIILPHTPIILPHTPLVNMSSGFCCITAAALGVRGGGSSTKGSCMPVNRLIQALSNCLCVDSKIRLPTNNNQSINVIKLTCN